MNTKKMKIGILTAGGDCPGLNAAIRGVGKAAILKYGMEVFGFSSGYLGLINEEYTFLDERALSGILTLGGTVLGTSREKPFKANEYEKYINSKPDMIKQTYKNLGLDCVVCIGGNGTMKTAYQLSQEGLNVVGIPKTIDNDVWGTDISFGFNSAVNIATDAIDRIHTTANSHKRIMLVEIMGHNTGWLTLYSGIAGGADVILIPEIEYDLDVIAAYIERRAKMGKPYSIIAVAEGINIPDTKTGKKRTVSASSFISQKLTKRTGFEMRETILGYIQRGGSPSPSDRIIATELGAFSADMIAEEKFGQMAAFSKGQLKSVPLDTVAGKIKLVPKDHALIAKARALDTCFGDY